MISSFDDAKIRSAITKELKKTSKQHRFRVRAVATKEKLFEVYVEPVPGSGSNLSETLEDGAVSWSVGNRAAIGRVLCASPEEFKLVIIPGARATEPEKDSEILVRPIDFLEPLLECWENEAKVRDVRNWIRRGHWASSDRQLRPNSQHKHFKELRQRQREAFGLTQENVSFLWGPPGTGKTHTLARMIAGLLLDEPDRKILLLGNTNLSVDVLLTALDQVLQQLNEHELRKRCGRIGANFHARFYKDRRELLCQVPEELLERLARHQLEKPAPQQAEDYHRWKNALREIEAKVRDYQRGVFQRKSVLALTACRAAKDHAALSEVGFDCIVFDEASQIPLAYTLMLAQLGNKAIFAGDPRQLAPIYTKKDDEVERWLGHSAFELMDSSSPTVTLDEQSRMAPAICRVVSEIFYSGSLKVAKDKSGDQAWLGERGTVRLRADLQTACLAFNIHKIKGSARREVVGGGSQYREESVAAVVQVVTQLLGYEDLSADDILILTPFRAQRARIRKELDARNCEGVAVGTVHSAQGTERKVVLFDPVNGASDFLSDKQGSRLINVALSRAMAQVFLFLSDSDLSQRDLKRVSELVALRADTKAQPTRERRPAVIDMGKTLNRGRLTDEDRYRWVQVRQREEGGWVARKVQILGLRRAGAEFETRTACGNEWLCFGDITASFTQEELRNYRLLEEERIGRQKLEDFRRKNVRVRRTGAR